MGARTVGFDVHPRWRWSPKINIHLPLYLLFRNDNPEEGEGNNKEFHVTSRSDKLLVCKVSVAIHWFLSSCFSPPRSSQSLFMSVNAAPLALSAEGVVRFYKNHEVLKGVNMSLPQG